MKLPADLVEQLVAHAAAQAPVECCGLLAAHGDIVRAYPATNAADSEFRYEIDGPEQMELQAQIEADGLQLVAVYHSHTHAGAYPSQTDIDLAIPHVGMVIIGVAGPAAIVCAYRIQDGRVMPG